MDKVFPTERSETILIFGAGGHGREVAWVLRACQPGCVIVFVVDQSVTDGGNVDGLAVVRFRDAVGRYRGATIFVGVGHPQTRRELAARAEGAGFRFDVAVHPNVLGSPTVRLGDGSVVFGGTVMTTNVTLGRHVHINSGCTLSHDVQVGDFVTISPGVHVAGNVTIQNDAFIGVGASVINGTHSEPIIIGRGAVVGAGACVTRSVEPGSTVVGVPARPVRGRAP